MHGKPLREIDEADLKALVDAATPEGLTLEFKRQVDLEKSDQKKEAAKDISALANTAGGRLLYGIAEQRRADGSTVAGQIVPVTDGSAVSRLSDILNSAIHPRPRFDIRAVSVAGGYVVVVEVYPSSGTDLHMVTAYGETRFYRRGPIGVVPMSEPEIREAYIRIGELRASLDARVDALVRPELTRRAEVDESILIVPLFSRPNFADPRQLRDLGRHLQQGILAKDDELRNIIWRLKLRHDGYRLILGGDAPEKAGIYIAILKSGVVHWSYNGAFQDSGTESHFFSLRATYRILKALIVSREVFRLCAYSGPVRMLYQLRPTKPWRIDPDRWLRDDANPPGVYGSEISDFRIESTVGSWGLLVKELLDPIFHVAGDFEIPHFTQAGALKKAWAKDFAEFLPYISVEAGE
jgi:hypothetical protein